MWDGPITNPETGVPIFRPPSGVDTLMPLSFRLNASNIQRSSICIVNSLVTSADLRQADMIGKAGPVSRTYRKPDISGTTE
jgi:hypothetical protein